MEILMSPKWALRSRKINHCKCEQINMFVVTKRNINNINSFHSEYEMLEIMIDYAF